MSRATGVLPALLLLVCGAASGAPNWGAAAPAPLAAVDARMNAMSAREARLLALVNRDRVCRGEQPVVWDADLAEAARQHSEEMARLGYFDHSSPVAGLESPADRYEQCAVSLPDSYTLGENLFYGSEADASWGHRSLMASPEHRANILNPGYTRVGIGVYVSGDGQMWVTQMFLG